MTNILNQRTWEASIKFMSEKLEEQKPKLANRHQKIKQTPKGRNDITKFNN